LKLEEETVPLTQRGWLPLQVPFFWHVLFESPLRMYVLLQKYSTYFILPSEPETSAEYPLWTCGGVGHSFMITSVNKKQQHRTLKSQKFAMIRKPVFN